MTLEDFEKKLAEEHERIDEKHSVAGDDRRHRSHRHHHHHQKRKHHREHKVDEDSHKRSKRSDHEIRRNITEGTSSPQLDSPDHWLEEHTIQSSDHVREDQCLKRDPWMEAPAALDIDYVQKSIAKPSQPRPLRSSKADFELRIHDKELNRHHLSKGAEGQEIPEGVLDDSAQHVVPYTFGDAGSQWRMTKLKNVFRQAEESGRSVEDVAQGVYGDLRSFDDAREEQVELDRRDTYGPGYVRKEKPSGDLFQERKMDMGVRRRASAVADEDSTEGAISPAVLDTQLALSKNSSLDQSALNRLKAQMIKAKLRGSADAPKLEAEYNTALAAAITTATPDSVVLGAMESSMLAGGRKGEVKAIESNRGRERGLVEENEDMSIEDMVREERRTRHQAGGESKRFAERIAKDGKFDVIHIIR